jgi:hypothetical protein
LAGEVAEQREHQFGYYGVLTCYTIVGIPPPVGLSENRDSASRNRMSVKKSRRELEEENSFLRRVRNASVFASIVNNLIRWAGLVAIFYIIYLCISALAGNTTVAKIGLNVLGDVRLSDALGYVFGGSGIAYGIAQKRLRRRKTHHLQGRIKELETKFDLGRTSSGLTTHGDTHPMDI